jgi:hypothetical protein
MLQNVYCRNNKGFGESKSNRYKELDFFSETRILPFNCEAEQLSASFCVK